MAKESNFRLIAIYIALLPIARAVWLRSLSGGEYWKTGEFWQVIAYSTLAGVISVLMVETLNLRPFRLRFSLAMWAGLLSGTFLLIRVRKDHPYWTASVVGEVIVWFFLALLCACLAEYIVAKNLDRNSTVGPGGN